MAILLRLVPFAILIAIIVFVLTIRKGQKAAARYAMSISASIIAVMVVIALIAHNTSGSEADWPYVLIILAALISITGSAAGLLLGYYFNKRFNR